MKSFLRTKVGLTKRKPTVENLSWDETDGLAKEAGLAHVAIIMDGNRRWAKARGLSTRKGHEAGARAAEQAMRTARHLGIQHLTLYGFSTENWKRPTDEIRALFSLMASQFQRILETQQLADSEGGDVAFNFIGNRAELDADLVASMEKVEALSPEQPKLHVHIALNYGGRADLVDAARHIAAKVQSGHLDPERLTEADLASGLALAGVPDPDLLIRTSGEQRLSNFLIWELAYSEFLFLNCFWPDFQSEDFTNAIKAYQNRLRRFGGRLQEDIHDT